MDVRQLTPEYQALLWAAGLRDEAPDGLTSDSESVLLQLAARHRLVGRLASRLRAERSGWATRRLMLAAWQEQRGIVNRFHRQLAMVTEIATAMRGCGGPLILIKGYAVHACLGDDRAIRHSNDLDMFHGDLPALYEVCRRLGYTGPVAEGHEYAQMKRPGICIELHRHLMVASYPASADPVPPGRLPSGHYFQDAETADVTELRYDGLLPSAAPGRTAGMAAFAVPSLAMCALIACAHEFREFIGRPWRQSCIKLAVFSEVMDLVGHPAFDASEFSDLVCRFHAHDSVAFIGYMLEAFSGRNPLPPVPSRSPWARQGVFPQMLTPMGPWVVLDHPFEMLKSFNADRDPLRLGGHPVHLPEPGCSTRLSFFNDAEKTPCRVLAQGNTEQAFPFAVTVTRTGNGLSIRVAIPEDEPRYDYVATVMAFHCAITPNRMAMVAVDTCPEARLTEPNTVREPSDFTTAGHGGTTLLRLTTGWCLNIDLAWSALTPAFAGGGVRPLWLRVVRWDRGAVPYEAARPVVCVPLELSLE